MRYGWGFVAIGLELVSLGIYDKRTPEPWLRYDGVLCIIEETLTTSTIALPRSGVIPNATFMRQS